MYKVKSITLDNGAVFKYAKVILIVDRKEVGHVNKYVSIDKRKFLYIYDIDHVNVLNLEPEYKFVEFL